MQVIIHRRREIQSRSCLFCLRKNNCFFALPNSLFLSPSVQKGDIFIFALLKSLLFSPPVDKRFAIQALWDQCNKAVEMDKRKNIIGQIQKMIHDRAMVLPLTTTNSPAAFGPRPKGNPYKIQPLNWFTSPFEDMELNR